MPIVAPKKSRKKIKEQSRIQKLSRSRVRGVGRGLIASFLLWMERNNARETYGTGARVNRGAHCFAIGWRNCRNFEGGMDREIASPVIDCSITFSASACRVAPANESLFPLSPFFTPSPFSAPVLTLFFFFPPPPPISRLDTQMRPDRKMVRIEMHFACSRSLCT